MGISIDSKCIVRGEEKHLNKLNDFLTSLKDDRGYVDFDRLCDYIPIYDPELETSGIRANLDQNEIKEINDEKVLEFWVHGWKGDYLDYIKQLIKDKELGFYDKNSESRSFLELFYLSYIESSDYYITNDEDGEFFSCRYIVTDSENLLSDEYETEFDSEEDVIDYFKENIKDKDLSNIDDLETILETVNDEDYYFNVINVKTVQEIEEEERRKRYDW